MADSIINRIVADRPAGEGTLTVTGLGHRTTLPLAEFHDRARTVAGVLRSRGIGAGDRVGILAANRLEWALLDVACLMIKAQTAGFEPGKFSPDADLIEGYDLDLLYTDVPLPDDAPRQVLPISTIAGDVENGVEPDAADFEPAVWSPTDCTTVKFTSGSTGIPKGLEATVGSIDSSLHAVQSLFDHQPGDNILTFLPLSLLQQRYWLYSALYWGHDITITTYQSVYAVMSTIRPTVVMGVPAFFDTAKRHLEDRLADGIEPEKAAHELFGDRVRYLWTGSAPADPATLRFFDEIGLPIFEGYGLNETCITTKNHPGAHRVGSVGKPLPGKEILIDAEGVVCVRSDHPVNTAYTYAAAGDSARMFKPGGVVRTGDLGRLDEDGFLYILGRADDVIVLDNAKKIIVRPIETRFRDTGAIAECVLYHPSPAGLVAVVSPHPGPIDTAAIAEALEKVNAASERDERICRVIVAAEPFTIENGLLTSQFKPIRGRIADRHRALIDDPKVGIHAR
ncbi:AMP-dependent synthetase and ligase [Catenulispora acidiphila DSM 44928]|uniref:AMP-dependent synthetase and ligase n=1 Tax=Catenulispora acidiphila (strain DSM 44928 / JCM 14897 / NBRC 102108 / NRRL B-24433 / ID139908) TaxID=479433 RepID=C7QK97_CATAD|nr:AMP-binding protein [Catenulispora acidiphila]ACU75171.1 AMP-dependent synthetase and ligase [Catenulispora acidiphila DSM 44928]